MNIRSKGIRALSMLIYSVGVLIGITFLGFAVWGDLEAFLFDSSIGADASLKSLSCPVVISASETGTVSASFKNPTENPIRPLIRVHISKGLHTLMREFNERLPIAAGQTERLEWVVSSEDAVYGYLILARVHMFRQYPLPSRTGACGIFVVDMPYLSGSQMVNISLASSLMFMLGGGGSWYAGSLPLKGRTRTQSQAIFWLAAVIIAGLIFILVGEWLVSGVLFVISLLLILAFVSYALLP